MAHHTAAYQGLQKEHIDVGLSVFQCGIALFDPQQIDEHCRQIHGLESGINTLSPLQVINVDKDQVFECPDLRRMEDVGPEERMILADSVYNMSIANGVLEVVNNNKSMADLKRNRAQEFLREVEKACHKQFFGRFKMLIAQKVRDDGGNILGDFTAKWGTIQTCLFSAVSEEQGVARMTNFLTINHIRFGDAPLEQLVYKVDMDVDTFLGNSSDVFTDSKKKHCLFTHNLLTKYEINFDFRS